MESTYVKVRVENKGIIEKLKVGEKMYVYRKNVFPSPNLIKTNNPLWGFYNVLSFIIDEEEFYTKDLFEDKMIVCGDYDCFMGECIMKEIKLSLSAW
jgi:hypothetical protein